MAHFFYLAKLVFLLLLASACFIFFGLPLFKKFFAKEVIVVESLEKRDFLKSPTITVCPDLAWINSSKNEFVPVGYFKEQCPTAKTAEEFENCVENKTYDLSETIEATSHGVTTKSMKNLSDPDFWTWDMVALGKCYTLN